MDQLYTNMAVSNGCQDLGHVSASQEYEKPVGTQHVRRLQTSVGQNSSKERCNYSASFSCMLILSPFYGNLIDHSSFQVSKESLKSP